jgi:YihY family inner membrane protein
VSVATLPLRQLLTPFGLLALLLYLIFKHIPKLRVSRRAAAVGALSAALILSVAKLGFGLYAQLAVSLHALWGAVAFVPLFLLWVLLSWYAVLFAAAVVAVLHGELLLLENPALARRSQRRRRRSRLRQRLVQRMSLPGS